MSHTPSASRAAKRKSPATAPAYASRKRARISDDVYDRPTSEPRRRKQQTLTQLDFVQSPHTSFNGNDDLQEIGQGADEVPAISKRKPSRSKKRDSTLTQMPFFKTTQSEDQDLDDELIGQEGSSFKDQHGPGQLDGVDNGTRRLRKRQPAGGSRPDRPRMKAGIKAQRGGNSGRPALAQMHDPAPIETKPPGARRYGRRAKNAQPTALNQLLSNEQGKSQDGKQHTQVAPLEIQDSTDFNEDSLIYTQDLFIPPPAPITPRKRRTTVPSSQSPESLPPSTRRKLAGSTVKQRSDLQRTALREKSTNLPSKHFRISPLKKPPLFSEKPSPKLPAQPAILLSRTDLSSSSDLAALVNKQSRRLQASSSVEIAATSSINDGSDELSDQVDTVLQNASGSSALDHQRTTKSCAAGQLDGALADRMPYGSGKVVDLLPDLTRQNEDDDSDFGSPIANDTQFLIELHERTSSSPIPSSKISAVSDNSRPVEKSVATKPGRSAPQHVGRHFNSSSTTTPIPTPRLIRSSPQHPAVKEHAVNTTGCSSPASKHSSSSGYVTTTTLPLNDIRSPQFSSSPLLLPAVARNQTSVNPASIPHLSQMSTQEPTQSLLPSSVALQTICADPDDDIERISVKDSSSISGELVYIPSQHSQGLNIDLVQGSDGEDEDLDLDRRLLPPPRSHLRRRRTVAETQTQTPTQHNQPTVKRAVTYDNSSSPPIVTYSTTRASRDAKLEVVPLLSSQLDRTIQDADLPDLDLEEKHDDTALVSNPTPTSRQTRSQTKTKTTAAKPDPAPERDSSTQSPSSPHVADDPRDSSDMHPSQISTPSPPPPLRRKYSPIPGFDNDTQSDFTRDGHVTAAYIHRQRESGLYPGWFVPRPYQAKKRGGAE